MGLKCLEHPSYTMFCQLCTSTTFSSQINIYINSRFFTDVNESEEFNKSGPESEKVKLFKLVTDWIYIRDVLYQKYFHTS